MAETAEDLGLDVLTIKEIESLELDEVRQLAPRDIKKCG